MGRLRTAGTWEKAGALGRGAGLALLVAGLFGVVVPTARIRAERWAKERALRRAGTRGPAVPGPGAVPAWPRPGREPTRTPGRVARGLSWGEAAFLESGRIWGTVEGPVASLELHYEFRHQGERGNGLQVGMEIPTPPVAAVHDFWITEDGAVWPGRVRARPAARAAYEAYLPVTPKPRPPDPGLVEFVREGELRFSMFPVVAGGRSKEAGWKMDLLLEPDAGGWVALALPAPRIPVEAFEVGLAIHEPRGVAEWRLPEGFSVRAGRGPDHHVVCGRWEDFTVSGAPAIRWRLAAGPGGPGAQVVPGLATREGALLGQRVDRFGFGGELCLTLVHRGGLPAEGEAVAAGVVRGPGPVPAGGPGEPYPVALAWAGGARLDVPGAVLDRLEAAGAAMAATARLADPGARAEAQQELARLAVEHRLASPVASLFAKPGPHRDDGFAELVEGAYGTELMAGHVKVEVPDRAVVELAASGTGLFPVFRAARERSGIRACFAVQKTIAGAAEMYEFDFGVDLMADAQSPPTAIEATWVARLVEAGGSPVRALHGRTFGTGNTAAAPRWRRLDDLYGRLKENGYLQSIPNDPGYGPASGRHYILTDLTPDGVICLVHGPIRERPDHPDPLETLITADPSLRMEAREAFRSGKVVREPLARSELELLLLVLVYAGLVGAERFLPGVARQARIGAGYLVTLLAVVAGTGLAPAAGACRASVSGLLGLGAVVALVVNGRLLAGSWPWRVTVVEEGEVRHG